MSSLSKRMLVACQAPTNYWAPFHLITATTSSSLIHHNINYASASASIQHVGENPWVSCTCFIWYQFTSCRTGCDALALLPRRSSTDYPSFIGTLLPHHHTCEQHKVMKIFRCFAYFAVARKALACDNNSLPPLRGPHLIIFSVSLCSYSLFSVYFEPRGEEKVLQGQASCLYFRISSLSWAELRVCRLRSPVVKWA